MTEELLQEPVNEESTPDPDSIPNPVTSSVNKLREVSQAVTQLGEDLRELVSVLEELTSMLSFFSSLGNKGAGQPGSTLPLALLTSLLSKSGQDSSENSAENSPDLKQLLFALLSQQLSQNK